MGFLQFQGWLRGVEDKLSVMLSICYQLLHSKTFCIVVANFKV